jgi:hypothetical protein
MENLQERTLDLLMETGLNWTVTKESLMSFDGKPTDSFGLFRSDNGQHLATVQKRYEVYQNFELAEAILEATQTLDLNVTRGGELSGGRKVYLQAELPEVYIGKSGMQRWITGVNSHTGKSKIGFGSSGTVIVCQNTWYKAYGELAKFAHNSTAAERVNEFIKGMRLALGLDENLIKKFRIMADQPIKDEIIAKVMNRAFEVDLDIKQSEINPRAKAKAARIAAALATEVELQGSTLWALFNGVTRYTNHIATKPEKAKEYVMTGAGYDTNLVAFDTIMEWIEANSEPAPAMIEI